MHHTHSPSADRGLSYCHDLMWYNALPMFIPYWNAGNLCKCEAHSDGNRTDTGIITTILAPQWFGVTIEYNEWPHLSKYFLYGVVYISLHMWPSVVKIWNICKMDRNTCAPPMANVFISICQGCVRSVQAMRGNLKLAWNKLDCILIEVVKQIPRRSCQFPIVF